jgi:HAD superfamily hydrolase (TIGR01544 family)
VASTDLRCSIHVAAAAAVSPLSYARMNSNPISSAYKHTTLVTYPRIAAVSSLIAISTAAAYYLYRTYSAHKSTKKCPSSSHSLACSSHPPFLSRARFDAFLEKYSSQDLLIIHPDQLFSTVNFLIADGADHVQIISDFDRTLSSAYSVSGDASSSSHGVIENSQLLHADYRSKAYNLFLKYYPLEIDSNLDEISKTKAMIEWWELAHNLMIEYQFNHNMLSNSVTDAISTGYLQLRPAAKELIQLAHSADIPFLVFSAGLGDSIEEFLRQTGNLASNVAIVSNKMQFNGKGLLVGFHSDIIHSLNKNYSHVINARNKKLITHSKHCKNVILLGDSLHDIYMIEGLDQINKQIKIGFFNEKSERSGSAEYQHRLSKYKSVYDVLVLHDGSMNFVVELLQFITGSP